MAEKITSQLNIEERFDEHTHNGIDAKKINFTDIEVDTQPAISAPIGGLTVDQQARDAINSIRSVLQNFGLTE